jgi:hypothetical protein
LAPPPGRESLQRLGEDIVKSISTALLTALALAIPTAAAAAPKPLICVGAAVAGPGALQLALKVDAKGKVLAGWAQLMLRRPGGDPPMVSARYDLADPLAAELGVANLVSAAHVASLEPRPTSPTADVVIKIGADAFRKPWGLYADAMAEPPDPKRVAFWGIVPLSGVGESLAAGQAQGLPLETMAVTGDGQVLSQGVFTLPTPAELQAAGRVAHAAALALAEAPKANCKPAPE